MRIIRKWGALVVLAMVITAGVSACGGSSKLSKADFIKKADAICKSATEQVDKIPKPASDNPSADEIKKVLQDSFNVIDPTVKKLDDLNGDDSIEAVLNDNLVQPTKAQSAAAHKALSDLQAAGSDTTKQQAAVEKLGSLDDPQQEQHDKALADAGFTDCSTTNQ